MSKNKKPISTSLIIALLSAIVLSGIIAWLALQFFQKSTIVVSAKSLKPYSGKVTSADFKTIEIAKRDKDLFQGFVENPAQLDGKMPVSDIVEGQPVKMSQFIDPNNAEQISNVVSDKSYRGIYLPLTKENAMNGDIKIGSVIDLYITTSISKPTLTNPQNMESIVVPFQKSFKVAKLQTNDDGSLNIFFEFPMADSEKYVMLKNNLKNKKMELVSTMPNVIHTSYNGSELTLTDFNNALISDSNYFTSVHDLDADKGKNNGTISSTNTTNKNTNKTTNNGGTTSTNIKK